MGRNRVEFSKAFAIVVKRHRTAQNLSRHRLAEIAGVHQTYVGLVERGLRNPTLDTAEMLARSLKRNLSELILEAEAVHATLTPKDFASDRDLPA